MATWRAAGFPIEARATEAARALGELCLACGCPNHEHDGFAIEPVAPI